MERTYNRYAEKEFSAHYFYGDIEVGDGGAYHLCAIGGEEKDHNAERVVEYINFLTDIISNEVSYDRFNEWRHKNPLLPQKETK